MTEEPVTPTATGIRSKEDVIALAVSLARPVVREMLPLDHAQAAIAAAVGRACRLGILDDISDPEGLIDVANHILDLNITIQEDKRDAVTHAIARTIRPLIDKQQSIGRLRAEAHDVNAEGGSLLSDAEVEQAVVHALYQARARLAPKPPFVPRRYYG
jgi:hypothetical protein